MPQGFWSIPALAAVLCLGHCSQLARVSWRFVLRTVAAAWTENIWSIWSVCGIGGATLVLMLGTILFVASLGPARPL